MSEIQKLYEEYKQFLASDTSVMRDGILFVLIRMEEQIQGILGTTEVNGKRENRYKLANQPNPQFRTKIAKEAQILHDNIGSGLSIQHMLGQIVRRQNQIKNLLSDASYEDICRDLGIVYQIHSDGKTRPFVPTDTNGKSPQIGSGNGWEAETRQPKFLEFISLLRTIRTPGGGFIDTRDIRVDCQTDTPDTMVRTLPYVVIRIPRLHRTILIDDRIGEATFVFQGILDLDIVRGEPKTGLATYHGGKRIIYDKNWADTVGKYLITDWERESGSEASEKNIPKSRINIDRASLFMDNEFIRDTLERFAGVVGISIVELSATSRQSSIKTVLSNGIGITWNSFLDNASQYLLGTNKEGGNSHRRAEALDLLCERMGVVRNKPSFLDASYFSEENTENLHTDLKSFAQKGNISLARLSTGTPPRNIKITLSNGMEMTWQTFLNIASKYLLGTNFIKNNRHRAVTALDLLCERVGVIRLNKEYFTNSAYILSDLESFAKVANISLTEITTSTPKLNTRITLFNGVKMTWQTFLDNASQYLLGTSKERKNSHRRAEALDLLYERVGTVRNKPSFLDVSYFDAENTENIYTDLLTFAREGNIPLTDFSTSTPPRNTKITLSNGMQIIWQTFLDNASQYLLKTSQTKENRHSRAKALDLLCERVGVVRTTKKSK